MKKISFKIILSAIITLIISGLLSRGLIYLSFSSRFGGEITEGRIFINMLFSLMLTIIIFTFMINQFVVKRIKRIDYALKDVQKGNFDVFIDDSGKDEISQLSKNFNLMTEELKSNEYLNKDFVRNFSHEFKTPLSIIRGYAEMIEEKDMNHQEVKEYLKIIISETERLSKLTNNMLQVSMIDNQSIINKEDYYNVAEQIRNIIQMTQVSWETKDLLFDLELNDIHIKSNKELTYQVLLNLINNAIKFSDKKSTIQIELKDHLESIYCSVTNQGEEIPEEDFKKVFQLFYVKNQEKYAESTGVGLALTKKIIDKLGGSIEFSSKKEQTTFTFTLDK